MSWIIDKIRLWFCKHEWELLKEIKVYEPLCKDIPIAYEWIYVCKKMYDEKSNQDLMGKKNEL